jgi:hypothetical protein
MIFAYVLGQQLRVTIEQQRRRNMAETGTKVMERFEVVNIAQPRIGAERVPQRLKLLLFSDCGAQA